MCLSTYFSGVLVGFVSGLSIALALYAVFGG